MTCPNYGAGNCGPTVTTTVVSIPPGLQTAPGSLPFTGGGDVVVIGGLGIMLLLAGIGASLAARKFPFRH